MNKEQVIQIATDIAAEVGLANVTRHAIAKRSGVAYGTVFNWLGDKMETRCVILKHAIETENLSVIADGITSRHPTALGAPSEIKQRAIAALI